MALAFLFDVDNTLIDNDRVKRHMEETTRELLGAQHAERFWEIYEEVREECDFVDFPRTLDRFANEYPDEARFPDLAGRLLCYPYEEYVFPGALDAIRHAKQFGSVAIVSDGDRVFQPSKIGRAGLAQAVDNRVLIFTHKEEEFEEVERRVPAERYVAIDDKPSILTALKERLGERVVTVHVKQGKYASEDPGDGARPDVDLRDVGELVRLDRSVFEHGAAGR